MIVKLKDKNSLYPDLSSHHHYVVIGIEADDFRILNDQGKPYLYPNHLFEMLDIREPSDWVNEVGEDGERYAYPSALNRVAFFEDFFDAKKEAVSIFWGVINQHLAAVRVA